VEGNILGEVEALFTSRVSFAWHVVISLALAICVSFRMVFACLWTSGCGWFLGGC